MVQMGQMNGTDGTDVLQIRGMRERFGGTAGCEAEVNRRLGRAWGVMDSLNHGV